MMQVIARTHPLTADENTAHAPAAGRFGECVRYFRTYEQREEAFRQCAFAMVPRKHLGPGPFWADFRRISAEGFAPIGQTPIAFVTSNPRDCLAFGTARQVLDAACLAARGSDAAPGRTAAEVAAAFGLSANIHQPVRTLSGGETVKLALAKTHSAAAVTCKLVIASPFSWLSKENFSHFETVLDRYRSQRLPVEILALEGEDSAAPIDTAEKAGLALPDPCPFTLRFENVRIDLGTSFNTLYSHRTVVGIRNFSADLGSPCLVVGRNGQGKSLVARVLAGAIACGGTVAVVSAGSRGAARLLFQDVIGQTLLRSFGAISDTCGMQRKPEALKVYRRIMAVFEEIAEKSERHARRSSGRTAAGSLPSLIEIKAILVAVRLAAKPGALILDEPDWGMARPDAVAFVSAVIRAAHGMGVPVLIISHKPWWDPIAAAGLRVERTDTRRCGSRESRFDIRLQTTTGTHP